MVTLPGMTVDKQSKRIVHATCGSDRCGNWAACDRRHGFKTPQRAVSFDEALVDLIRANMRHKRSGGG